MIKSGGGYSWCVRPCVIHAQFNPPRVIHRIENQTQQTIRASKEVAITCGGNELQICVGIFV